VLRADDDGRLPVLLPIRYGRMVKSPFTFYRGAASIMARDLQATPNSGIVTQICGDAHLANFGAYASPERRFVFDVNDFDETTAGGAWEWDLKRLATSFVVAAQSLTMRPRDCDEAARECVRSYRVRMNEFADDAVLDVWYAHLDEELLAEAVRGAMVRAEAAGALEEPSEASLQYFPKVAMVDGGKAKIVDKPPLVFHPPDDPGFLARVKSTFGHYLRSMPNDRRTLVERFRFADAAYKVVGVGSVGTRCAVVLFTAVSGEPLFLQFKEARQSVYAPFTPKQRIADCAERVVAGQRLMQAATDVFLGWAQADDGRYYYVRQLRDLKTGADIDHMRGADLKRYASLCGWALARAHAKASGTAAAIAGYLGKNAAFDDAIVAFANAYAEQNVRDHAALVAAVDVGKIEISQA
jgi:uncharacterized protein (DUF2252 family)